MPAQSSGGLPKWIRVIMEYAAAHNQKAPSSPAPDSQPSHPGFADMELPGEEERRQPLPSREQRPAPAPERPISALPKISAKPQKPQEKPSTPSPLPKISAQPIHKSALTPQVVPHYRTKQERFLAEMKIFADRKGRQAPFVTFFKLYPVYTDMTTAQRAWYFCWRNQVRSGVYPKTDLGYLYLHIFEILSGVGWETPQDGYDQLARLWTAYEPAFPMLEVHLLNWLFDFSYLHNLPYQIPEGAIFCPPHQAVAQNILLERHIQDRPLKLPFPIIISLCDYLIQNSKFYSDGHQRLMEEAIPRVVSLADAALLKQKGRGLLSVYGPSRPKKQLYRPYLGAITPDAGQEIELSLKAYSTSKKLRGYITELVRYAENVLRSLYHCRGRLRDVTLDEETAALVEAFLKKEYDPNAKPEPSKKAGVTLDFDSIHTLREQSKAVRESLEVPEAEDPPESTATPEEMQALLGALSPEARMLLGSMADAGWELPLSQAPEALVQDITRLSCQYLARPLAREENGYYSVEPEYWALLAQAFAAPAPDRAGTGTAESGSDEVTPAADAEPEDGTSPFDLSVLSEPVSLLVQSLSPVHQAVLFILLSQPQPAQMLEALAEENLTMPQLLMDEINDMAMTYLNDILIDAMEEEPRILEQYAPELRQSIEKRNA